MNAIVKYLFKMRSAVTLGWAEFYNRNLAKFLLTKVTSVDQKPHLTKLKNILNVLNAALGFIGISIIGEFKFTKMTYFIITFISIESVFFVNTLVTVNNMSLFCQCLIFTGFLIASDVKLYKILCNNDKLVCLLKFNLHVFNVNYTRNRAAILNSQLERNKKIVLKVVYTYMCGACILSAGVLYAVFYLGEIPFPLFIPFVDITTTTGYAITLLNQVIAALPAIILSFSYTTLFALLVLHYGNMVEVIRHNLMQVSSPDIESDTRNIFLINIAVQTIDALRYSKYLGQFFKIATFWQVASSYVFCSVAIFIIICKIALLDIDHCEETITKLREDFPTKQILFHLTDVVSRNDLQNAFEEIVSKFGLIDCVIACAGVFDELNYERTININLVGLIHTNYIALLYMGKDKGKNGGLIVNIASVTGLDCTQFCTPTYNATKHGVVAFSRSLGDSYYYEETGVKCIAVCPGITYTKFLNNVNERCYSEEAFECCKQKLKHALKQTVDEFSAAFIEVLQQDKNGAVWLIDGGKYKEIERQNPWLDNANAQEVTE